ncbi:MAG: C39 family peptidase [Gemmatales bacterium]
MPRHYRPIPHNAIRIEVPDTTQQTDYSCGASSLQAIAKYFGVGPDDEPQFVKDTGMNHAVGAHPDEIEAAAHHYGLSCLIYEPMNLVQLRAELRQGHPVMVMIQAWGEVGKGSKARPRKDYANCWTEGHWVVAIGYDKEAVFFEDPSLQAVRGYLLNDEFDQRWHDTARHNRHVEHLGMAIWLPGCRRSVYATRAQRIQ